MTYRLYGSEETGNNTKKGKHTERKRATKVMETVTERKNTHIKWFIIFFYKKATTFSFHHTDYGLQKNGGKWPMKRGFQLENS